MSGDSRRLALKTLVFGLNEANQQALHYLLAFLYLYALVPLHASKNKANISSIAETFGPLVFRQPAALPAPASLETASSPTPSAGPAAVLASPSPTEQPAAPSVRDDDDDAQVNPETARVLLQSLLEGLPDLFPRFPSICPLLPSAPMFGVPLAQVMQSQSASFPSLKVPFFIDQGASSSSSLVPSF